MQARLEQVAAPGSRPDQRRALHRLPAARWDGAVAGGRPTWPRPVSNAASTGPGGARRTAASRPPTERARRQRARAAGRHRRAGRRRRRRHQRRVRREQCVRPHRHRPERRDRRDRRVWPGRHHPKGSGPTARRPPCGRLPPRWRAVPRGAEVGTFVHAVLERVDFSAADLDGRGDVGRRSTSRSRRGTDVGSLEQLSAGLVAALSTPLGPLVGGRSLRDLRPGRPPRRASLRAAARRRRPAGGAGPHRRHRQAVRRLGGPRTPASTAMRPGWPARRWPPTFAAT